MTPDEFKQTRERIGITKTQLARLLGVSPVTVNRWESYGKGNRAPNQIACTVLRWLDQGFMPPGFSTSQTRGSGSKRRSPQQQSTRADR